jgi:hypothetical protein
MVQKGEKYFKDWKLVDQAKIWGNEGHFQWSRVEN